MDDTKDHNAEVNHGESDAYWREQKAALNKAHDSHSKWTKQRRSKASASKFSNRHQTWKRETFALPRKQAQEKAKAFLQKYPKAAYWSEVEAWRELPDDVIEFTMRRLPTAD